MQSLVPSLQAGNQISRATRIGYVGNTGTSSQGVHLHLDISEKKAFTEDVMLSLSPDDALNPLAFFSLQKGDYTISNGILFGSDMN